MNMVDVHDDWPIWRKLASVVVLLLPVMAWMIFSDGRYFPLFVTYGLGVSHSAATGSAD